MARTINKSMTVSTIHVFDPAKPFETNEQGMPIANVIFNHNGNVNTLERGQRLAELHCKSKNVLCLDVTKTTTKSSLSPATFFINSNACKDGVSYGHDTITQEFVFTFGSGFYMSDNGLKPLDTNDGKLYYFGKTTMSKYINFLRETLGTTMVSVTELKYGTQKRWMPKEKYAQLATVSSDNDNDNNDGNDETDEN